MKYCRSCRHLSAGSPIFCPACGRSYNARVCPRGHLNARAARVCGICGARDLSEPHRSRPMHWARFRIAILVVLWLSTVVYAEAFTAQLLLSNPDLLPAMLPGLALALLWSGLVGLSPGTVAKPVRR